MNIVDPAAPLADLITYNNIVFHHLPNWYAPSFLVSILLHAVGFGALLLDMLSNVSFDVRLVRSKGWTSPIKALNRVAYFVMRICAILYLGLMLYYVNVQRDNCQPLYNSILATWYTALICMDFIFIARTLALYNWRTEIVVPIGVLYVAYTAIGAYVTSAIGHAYQLPLSHFCVGFTTDHNITPFRQLLIAYYALSCTCDTIILLLTVHRLARVPSAGQVYSYHSEESATSTSTSPRHRANYLSKTLLVQGFIFYGCFWAIKVAFIITHYHTDSHLSWIVVVTGIAATTNTIAASMLIRQTSDVVRQAQKRSSYYHVQNSHALPPPLPLPIVTLPHDPSSLVGTMSPTDAKAEKSFPRRPDVIVLRTLGRESDAGVVDSGAVVTVTTERRVSVSEDDSQKSVT